MVTERQPKRRLCYAKFGKLEADHRAKGMWDVKLAYRFSREQCLFHTPCVSVHSLTIFHSSGSIFLISLQYFAPSFQSFFSFFCSSSSPWSFPLVLLFHHSCNIEVASLPEFLRAGAHACVCVHTHTRVHKVRG